MAYSKQQFYSRGVYNQLHGDIIIELNSPDIKQIEKWTPAQKERMKEWIKNCESVFQAFKHELLSV